jgi:Ser/Thr protein kinase RdoA (MazF antagonist)
MHDSRPPSHRHPSTDHQPSTDHRPSFDQLSPSLALSAVEEAYGLRTDGSFCAYPSYVNRVYGFKAGGGPWGEVDGEANDEAEYVAKFYRPGRWQFEAIREEHLFANELAAAEIPVVAPLADADGETLQELVIENEDQETSIAFTLYPKRGGRSFDADGPADLARMGALAGRMHLVGLRSPCRHRTVVGPGLLAMHASELLDGGVMDSDAQTAMAAVLEQAAVLVDSAFAATGPRNIRLHGDFHRGNVLDRPGEGLLAIDFDDMSYGPAMQDLWMLLPGTAADSRRELDAALEGYESFTPFDWTELSLIEPLRLLRMVHYLAWQTRQHADPGFRTHFPGWGSRGFWQQEMDDLRMQMDRMLSASI